jgi:hypothetical protein
MKYLLASLAVGLILGTGECYAQFSNSAVAQGKSRITRLSDFPVVPGDEAVVTKTLSDKISNCVSQTNYLELDRIADELRKSKKETANGTWHLLVFYRVLALGELSTNSPTEEVWTARLSFLKAWTNTMPSSITARVALARYYKDYAWHARGKGFADTVSETGFKLFEERLTQAEQVLRGATNLEPKCPVWWDTMQFVALGLSWDLNSYNKLFDQAVAFDPAYVFFYNNRAVYLQPRWHGKEGDWQRFAVQAADRIGGDRGDILYARIGWRVHERRFYSGFLRDSGYSWARLKSGMEKVINEHPDSISAASELAYLAYQAKDQVCAKAQFERVGMKVDKEVWHSDQLRFMRARSWALE